MEEFTRNFYSFFNKICPLSNDMIIKREEKYYTIDKNAYSNIDNSYTIFNILKNEIPDIIDFDWTEDKIDYFKKTMKENKSLLKYIPESLDDKILWISSLENLCIKYDMSYFLCIVIKSIYHDNNIISFNNIIKYTLLIFIGIKRYLIKNGKQSIIICDYLSSVVHTINDNNISESKKASSLAKKLINENDSWLAWYISSSFFESIILYIYESNTESPEHAYRSVIRYLIYFKKIIHWLWNKNISFFRDNYSKRKGTMFDGLLMQLQLSFDRIFKSVPNITTHIINRGRCLRARKRKKETFYFESNKLKFINGYENIKSTPLIKYTKEKKENTFFNYIYNYFVPKKKKHAVLYEFEDNIIIDSDQVFMLPWFYSYNDTKNINRIFNLIYNYIKENINFKLEEEECIRYSLVYFLLIDHKLIEEMIVDFIIIPKIYLLYHIKSILISNTLWLIIDKFNLYDNLKIKLKNKKDINLYPSFDLNWSNIRDYGTDNHFKNLRLRPFQKLNMYQLIIRKIIDGFDINNMYNNQDSILNKNIKDINSKSVLIKKTDSKIINIKYDYVDKSNIHINNLQTYGNLYMKIGYSSITNNITRNGRIKKCPSCMSNINIDECIHYDINFWYPHFYTDISINSEKVINNTYESIPFRWLFKYSNKKYNANIDEAVNILFSNHDLFFYISLMMELEGQKHHNERCYSELYIKVGQEKSLVDFDNYIIHKCIFTINDDTNMDVATKLKYFFGDNYLDKLLNLYI